MRHASRESGAATGSQKGTRWPAFAAAAGILASGQAGFLAIRHQSFDLQSAIGLAKAGVVAGFATVLLVTPLVLVARRWHPAWNDGDRSRATRALLLAAVGGIATWMLVDSWVAGPLVPKALEPWIEIAMAGLVAGLVLARPPTASFCRRASLLLVPAAAVLLVPLSPPAAGEGAAADRPALAPGEAPRDLSEAPDVVLISIDTFRADRLGLYGNPDGLTPQIDRFGEEGLVFERAVAASPWTVPSVASMLTGLPTTRHGAGLPLGSGPAFARSPLNEDVVTLAEKLSAAGYETRAVVANGFVSPAMGMARGFDTFETPFTNAASSIFLRDIPLARLLFALYPVERWADYRARGVTDRALAILGEERSRPLFLWVHYIDPHTPFQADPGRLDLEAWRSEIHQDLPPPRDDGSVVGEVFAGTSNVRGGMLWLEPADRERIREYYDRAVSYVDDELGRLCEVLRRRHETSPVIAALTSDHGEELWDHGNFEHGHDYYREVTRIPLLLWSPGVVPRDRRGAEPVGLVDLPPTLLELAGFRVAAPALPDEGRSLVAAWRRDGEDGSGDGGTDAVGGWIRFSEGNLYGTPSVLLEEGSWRFILRAHGAGELYHVHDDPRELDNRAAEHPDLVARYRTLLEPRLAFFLEGGHGGDARALDAETKRALRSLGYVQ